MPMQEAAVSVTDLACRRGDRILFRGLGFRLRAGDALQVTAGNGVGKSSLLRILAGLAPAYAGTADISGSIGLIDERPALDPGLPLGRALAFWRRIDGPVDAELAQTELTGLGLTDLLDVPVRYLSTGQKKRAALARLIGQNARIWLLDEPLNGLDTHAAELTQVLVESHCAAGGIAIIASHQPFTVPRLTRLPLADYAA